MFRDPPNPGETHTNTRKIRGYYPDLRPEDANKEDHPNHTFRNSGRSSGPLSFYGPFLEAVTHTNLGVDIDRGYKSYLGSNK